MSRKFLPKSFVCYPWRRARLLACFPLFFKHPTQIGSKSGTQLTAKTTTMAPLERTSVNENKKAPWTNKQTNIAQQWAGVQGIKLATTIGHFYEPGIMSFCLRRECCAIVTSILNSRTRERTADAFEPTTERMGAGAMMRVAKPGRVRATPTSAQAVISDEARDNDNAMRMANAPLPLHHSRPRS